MVIGVVVNPREGAAVRKLVVKRQHTVWWKGASVRWLVEMRIHGAIMVHCRAQQVRASRQGTGPLIVEGVCMSGCRITGVRQVSVAGSPQSFHGGKEV